MAKVKDSTKIQDIDILWYCDDTDGYGVEILGDEAEAEIADFSFGQDKENLAYEFSFKFYSCITHILRKNYKKGLMLIEKLYSGYEYNSPKSIDMIAAFIGLWILLEDIKSNF